MNLKKFIKFLISEGVFLTILFLLLCLGMSGAICLIAGLGLGSVMMLIALTFYGEEIHEVWHWWTR